MSKALVKVPKSSDVIVVREFENGCRQIILNRKKAFNALTIEMFEKIMNYLKQWEQDPNVHCVVVLGVGKKAFCAGGDLKQFAHPEEGREKFTRVEYNLDHYIHHYPKPYICILNGITMGGGAGISINGKYRIATENLTFAMPECAVGFVADVGCSHFLNSCPGQIGTYLALTGDRINASDAIYANIATHYVPQSKTVELLDALTTYDLSKKGEVNEIISSFTEYTGLPSLAKRKKLIDKCFSANTVEEIIKRLKTETEDTAFVKSVIDRLHRNCPMSLKVTLAQMKLARMMTLGEVLKMEYRTGWRMVRRADIQEGVKSVLITKQRDNTPKWNPSTLEEISANEVEKFFAPLNPSDEIEFNSSIHPHPIEQSKVRSKL
jgi:enoyl-CoA hydratase